ncbi:hypothetical protein GGR50DRAFT_669545 [Xylaria sp. CBS 124048]|nr:hypothetical protein GGR50DRAFT_669545 [Xylaria sp. CBS 124048]
MLPIPSVPIPSRHFKARPVFLGFFVRGSVSLTCISSSSGYYSAHRLVQERRRFFGFHDPSTLLSLLTRRGYL